MWFESLTSLRIFEFIQKKTSHPKRIPFTGFNFFSKTLSFLVILRRIMFFFYKFMQKGVSIIIIHCSNYPLSALRNKFIHWCSDTRPGPLTEFCFSGKMLWIFHYFLVCVSFTNLVIAEDQCKIEMNIRGMALKGFVFKRTAVAAPHICDILCEREITCQSYNFNRKEQICELNNRTKDARPENFRSDPVWFYIRRLNGRGKNSTSTLNKNRAAYSQCFPVSRARWYQFLNQNRKFHPILFSFKFKYLLTSFQKSSCDTYINIDTKWLCCFNKKPRVGIELWRIGSSNEGFMREGVLSP